MFLPKQRKIRTFALLIGVITFTTFLFSYTFRDPSVDFFRHAFRLSDDFLSKGQCACPRCVAEAEDDPWFAERFNQSVHPLMTRENSVLSEETFKWWQWLQSERRPANFSEVVEELFRVIPDEVLYADAGPKRCRTCAVVGNSGNLKGAQYGALIDSFDFVVRERTVRDAQRDGGAPPEALRSRSLLRIRTFRRYDQIQLMGTSAGE